MPRPSRFRSRALVTGSRRQTAWSDGPFGTNAFTVSDTVLPFGTGFTSIEEGSTIVRFRGQIVGFLSASGSGIDGFERIAFGICIVSQNAAGIGVTAIPDPLVDIGWDGWLWHELFSCRGSLTTEQAQFRASIDNKAMRKFRATDVVVGMVSVGSEVGTATLQVALNSRMLLKLA